MLGEAMRLGSGCGAAGFGGGGGGVARYIRGGERWLGGGGKAAAVEESGSDSGPSRGGRGGWAGPAGFWPSRCSKFFF